MNTPITDAAAEPASYFLDSLDEVVSADVARRLELDRAALIERLEKSQALLAKLYDEGGRGTTIWHEFPRLNSDNIAAIAAARANFPER